MISLLVPNYVPGDKATPLLFSPNLFFSSFLPFPLLHSSLPLPFSTLHPQPLILSLSRSQVKDTPVSIQHERRALTDPFTQVTLVKPEKPSTVDCGCVGE